MLSGKQEHTDIMIVDDNPQNLTVLATILKREGYRVRPAVNGVMALKAIRSAIPDLILLDIVMPDLSGYDICRQLKNEPPTRDIPIIFISARSEVFDKIEAFEVGGVDYITKPFQIEEVLARVRAHLTIRKLQQQLQDENERYRGFFDATFEGVLLHEQGTIVDVNRALETLTGYPGTYLIGKPIGELLAPESRALIDAHLQRGATLPHEVCGLKKDGTLIFLEIESKAIHYQGRDLHVLAMRDITWRRQLEQENLTLKASLHTRDHLGRLVGQSAIMQKLYDRIIQAAAAHDTVIVYGETGTGKELAARTIFELRGHHTKSFVPVNCGAIPEALFEPQFFGYRKGAFTGADRDTPGFFDQAEGGTLFLDEVGELPLPMQAKLLRVLQDGEYTPVGATTSRMADVCIIAATNRELRKLVEEKKVREDFFHRLHVIALSMPPLRWHKEDIPLLISHFFQQRTSPGAPLPTLPSEQVERLLAYDWPGNIRELFNELRRYLAIGELELKDALSPRAIDSSGITVFPEGKTFDAVVAEVEKHLLTMALTAYDGSRVKTAEALQIPLRTLHRKIKQYHL